MDALSRQTYPNAQTELIVVDNGSSDRSIEIASQYPVKLLIRNEVRSPYWCRNAGIREAKGDIFVLLDSNCVPVLDWLSEGVKCFQRSNAAILMGSFRFSFSAKNSIAERIDFLYSVYTPEDVSTADALPGGHLFVDASVFKQVGYFIPHYRSLGDLEWTGRAKKHGYSFDLCQRALVDYPAKPFREAINKMIRLGQGNKEYWIYRGHSTLHPKWVLKILKNTLPPSPAFYKEMATRNQDEGTKIPNAFLYLGLYLIKLCYAWGMLFKKVARPFNDDR